MRSKPTYIFSAAALCLLALGSDAKAGILFGITGRTLISIDTSNFVVTELASYNSNFNGGGGNFESLTRASTGDFYATRSFFPTSPSPDPSRYQLWKIDGTTFEATLVGDDIGFGGIFGLAFSGDGTLFASSSSGVEERLITIDPSTGQGSSVGLIGASGSIGAIEGLEFHADGTLFAASRNNGIRAIDVNTAVPTFIGNTGRKRAASLGFTDNKLFGRYGISPTDPLPGSARDFISIDPSTAEVTDLFNLSYEITGLTGNSLPNTNAVPEPGSFAVFGCVGLVSAFRVRRKTRTRRYIQIGYRKKGGDGI